MKVVQTLLACIVLSVAYLSYADGQSKPKNVSTNKNGDAPVNC